MSSLLKNDRQFIQRNVQVTLGVFNDLRSLGPLSTGRLVRASGDDLYPQASTWLATCNGPRRDFLDVDQAMGFVAGCALRSYILRKVHIGQSDTCSGAATQVFFVAPGYRRLVDDVSL
jgi:hypothetical protein